ncbi:MAG: hypothetical protein ACR2J5_15530 [Geodermatophilaceae bacterium]
MATPPRSEELKPTGKYWDSTVGQTYVGLRLGMALLIVLLFGSLIIQSIRAGCVQTSISAYYHTATQPVFIAVLCALGACLIIMRGSTVLENVALDISGFLAFLVAFVPVSRDKSCGAQLTDVITTQSEIEVSIANNVPMILIVGFLATVLGMRSRWARPGEKLDPKVLWRFVITLVVIVAGFIVSLASPDWVREQGHVYFACSMFGGILLVLFANRKGAKEKAENGPAETKARFGRYATAYRWVIWAMAILSLIWLILYLSVGFKEWIAAVEATAIGGFAVFWILQTGELRGMPDREFMADAGGPEEGAVIKELIGLLPGPVRRFLRWVGEFRRSRVSRRSAKPVPGGQERTTAGSEADDTDEPETAGPAPQGGKPTTE